MANCNLKGNQEMLYRIKTPSQVNQYLGNKKDNLKLGCNTLFLLNVFSHLTFYLTMLDYTQVSLFWAMKLFTT